jgi:large subunit ribosomal protein L13
MHRKEPLEPKFPQGIRNLYTTAAMNHFDRKNPFRLTQNAWPLNFPSLRGGRRCAPLVGCFDNPKAIEGSPMSTYTPKPGEIQMDWHVVDATDKVLGRLAAKIAMILQGKTKPTYTPHVDTGDFVIVLNADKIKVTGKKADVIEYDTYSRYPGGRHLYSYKRMNQLHPERVIQLAVKRMLPKNKLGRNMLTKLKIYNGTEHPHSAQRPKELKLA